MTEETAADVPTAQALLARHHLFPNPDELPLFERTATIARADADRLYAVVETKYDEPGLIFHPRP